MQEQQQGLLFHQRKKKGQVVPKIKNKNFKIKMVYIY
jgi:hypothetical protein